ncbi:hypothetical protein CERZMDRAFT_106875 [Cercospora zeae-maydis SCOH1-5]|uniref:Uncharacterized protein n=1 Tax=Cercospora zeae-maydis SCOH1-5 TaxID=717836 RepID=A0A6A6FA43_9PEZI|nr:hypothetical protein CERZMDRAFT_106875 [Cercospora zeae-maydis SCOH1-5]
MLPHSIVDPFRGPTTESQTVGARQQEPQARQERHSADRNKCIMAATEPVVPSQATSYQREHLDSKIRLQPALTPVNTIRSNSSLATDTVSEYSETKSACEDQSIVLHTRQVSPSSTPAKGPSKGILQLPRPRSPSAGGGRTDKQKRAHFDEHLLDLDAAIRRVATDPSHLHSASPDSLHWQAFAPQTASHWDESVDEKDVYVHQRWTIEDSYDPSGGHIKEAAQNGSEFDADDNGHGPSQEPDDKTSIYSDVDQVPDLADSVESPAWRRSAPRGSASLEVCTSDEARSAEQGSDQPDDTSTQPDTDIDTDLTRDASIPRLQFLELWDERDFMPQERMYTMPSITEESLRTYEAEAETYPEATFGQGADSFPAYQEPECLSVSGTADLGLERIPSETRSAPAPTDRRGRRMTKAEHHPRHSSLTEVHRIKDRVRRPSFVSTKASPARPAMATVSVKTAESPCLNPVYAHPGARYMSGDHHKEPVKTAQTINSGLGTYKMMWEEEQFSSSGESSGTMLGKSLSDEHLPPTGSNSDDRLVAPTPMMEKVRSRLTAWTWERQQSPEKSSGWMPLLDTAGQRRVMTSDHSDSHELPPGPPNTALHSEEPSRPHSPGKSSIEEDNEPEQPIELRSRRVIATKPTCKPQTAHQTRASSPVNNDDLGPPRRNSLPASPTIPRQLSNLALEDLRFESHRDSVEITRGHMWIEGLDHRNRERPNSLLLAARDSFKLAKGRMDCPWLRTTASETHAYSKPISSSIQWSRFGGLSPIPDSSPPNASSGSFEQPSTQTSVQTGNSNAQHQDSPDSSPRKLPENEEDVGTHVQIAEKMGLQKRLERLEQRMQVLEDQVALDRRK